MSAVCHVPGCERRRYARGWCQAHWKRWRKHGDVCASKPISRSGLRVPADDCGRCEDIEWLLDAGADPHDLARRILSEARPDITPRELREQIRRHLARHGRDDLLARYNRAVEWVMA